jgi:hypothetical protein
LPSLLEVFNVFAVPKEFTVEQIHREQAQLEIVTTVHHLPRHGADRIVATVRNDWQKVETPFHPPPLHVREHSWRHRSLPGVVLEEMLQIISSEPLEHFCALLGKLATCLSPESKSEQHGICAKLHSIETYLAFHEPKCSARCDALLVPDQYLHRC